MKRALPQDAMPADGVPACHLEPYLADSYVAPCGARLRSGIEGRPGDSFSSNPDRVTCRQCLELAAREEDRKMAKKRPPPEKAPPMAVGDTVTLKEPFARVFRQAEMYSDLGHEEPMEITTREKRGQEVIWHCTRRNGHVVLARTSQLVRLTARGRKAAAA